MDALEMSIELLNPKEPQPWKSMLKPPPAFFLILILFLLPPAAVTPAVVYMAETPDLAAALTVLLKLRREMLRRREMTVPALHRHDTKFEPARTGGELLEEELGAAFMGGVVELLLSWIYQDKAPPTQICCAILVAAVLGGLWHRVWAPLRRRRAASTSQTPWRRFSDIALLSLLSGGWVWVATFSIASPTTTWSTYCNRAVATLMVGSSLWLVSLFVNSATLCLNRLRRQPQGLQGDHHVPSLDLEMQGHEEVA